MHYALVRKLKTLKFDCCYAEVKFELFFDFDFV